MKKNSKNSQNKALEDVAKALESCASTLSLNEFARVTGVRLELLRRFINERARRARADTWDKLYPTLKPYFTGPEPMVPPPERIGAPYRRHPELVDMLSDQKVLIDAFAVIPEAAQKRVIAGMISAAGSYAAATGFKCLSPLENQLMGAYLALDEAKRNEELLRLVRFATAEVHKRRQELF